MKMQLFSSQKMMLRMSPAKRCCLSPCAETLSSNEFIKKQVVKVQLRPESYKIRFVKKYICFVIRHFRQNDLIPMTLNERSLITNRIIIIRQRYLGSLTVRSQY